MSSPFGQVVLTLQETTQKFRDVFAGFTDPRSGKNKTYTMVDAALSAFSVFFTQSPSFLEYQRRLEQTQGGNNAQTLFGVHQIPSDNPIRTLLDATHPASVRPLFSYLFNGVEQSGIVEAFRSVGELCCSPWRGLSIFHLKRFIAIGARPASMATVR